MVGTEAIATGEVFVGDSLVPDEAIINDGDADGGGIEGRAGSVGTRADDCIGSSSSSLNVRVSRFPYMQEEEKNTSKAIK